MSVHVVVEKRARRIKPGDVPLRIFMNDKSIHTVNTLHSEVILVTEEFGFRTLHLANGDEMILRLNTLVEVGTFE